MRKPDLYIGGKEDPYLLRWHILPRNKYGFNIYLHKMLRDDDPRGLHDHPWPFLSIILWGGYIEVVPKYRQLWQAVRDGRAVTIYRALAEAMDTIEITRRWLSIRYRPLFWPHRLMLRGKVSWSLVITGRVVQPWGFFCRKGWVDSRVFCDNTGDESVMSRGCD